MSGRKDKSEDKMAHNQEDRAPDEHRGSLAFMVEEAAQERSDSSSADGEPTENVRSSFWRDAIQVALQHISSVTLEGEDSAVVEDAEQSHNPEVERAENLAEIFYLEFVLRIFLFSLQACGNELSVKLFIHEGKDDEIDKSDEEQYGAESNWSRNRTKLCSNNRAN